MTLTNLRPRLESPEVRRLMLALGYPAEVADAKADAAVALYRDNPAFHLFGFIEEGDLSGLLGLCMDAPDAAVIRHIVVLPEARRRGLGSRLIPEACARLGLRQLAAETDRDAEAFYRRCGFSVRSLGEVYPGTERFWCVLTFNPLRVLSSLAGGLVLAASLHRVRRAPMHPSHGW